MLDTPLWRTLVHHIDCTAGANLNKRLLSQQKHLINFYRVSGGGGGGGKRGGGVADHTPPKFGVVKDDGAKLHGVVFN
jgi:hypothetical protein